MSTAELILGTIEVIQGADKTATGLKWRSDVATYTPTSGPVAGEDYRVLAATFTAKSRIPLLGDDVYESKALFELWGTYGVGETGPYMANCRFVCEDQEGWEVGIELEVSFTALPTPIGTYDAPIIQYQGQANFRVDGLDDAKLNFVLSAGYGAQVWGDYADFEYGEAQITAYPFTVAYDGERHG
jgi:hypothetical protein